MTINTSSFASFLLPVSVLMIIATAVWWMGRRIHQRISGSSQWKQIQGQFIPEWMAGGILGSGLVFLFWSRMQGQHSSLSALAIGLLGMLVGWVFGMVHGATRVISLRRMEAEIDEHLPNSQPDDGNPYRSP